MGQAKTCKIGNKTFTVRELTLREIKTLTEGVEQNPIDAFVSLLTVSTDAKPVDLLDHAPSDVKEFVDTMIEVNAPFLGMAEAANMKDMADALRSLMARIFLVSFLPSSSEDTATESGTTLSANS